MGNAGCSKVNYTSFYIAHLVLFNEKFSAFYFSTGRIAALKMSV